MPGRCCYVSRRVNLPGAEELFRRTVEPRRAGEEREKDPAPPPVTVVASEATGEKEEETTRPKHGAKVAFYCTDEELTRLERARLTLRADHRITSDRGKLVRVALAEVLDDFEARGPQSRLVRRLKSTRP